MSENVSREQKTFQSKFTGIFNIMNLLTKSCSYIIVAEQKARTTYDNILRLVKDEPDVYEPIKFLRAREVVHFQRFGEALRIVQDKLDSKNFYAFNPEFDRCKS